MPEKPPTKPQPDTPRPVAKLSIEAEAVLEAIKAARSAFNREGVPKKTALLLFDKLMEGVEKTGKVDPSETFNWSRADLLEEVLKRQDFDKHHFNKNLSRIGDKLGKLGAISCWVREREVFVSFHGPMTTSERGGKRGTLFFRPEVTFGDALLSEVQYRRLTFSGGRVQAARFSPCGGEAYYAAAWGDQPLKVFRCQVDQPQTCSEETGLKRAGLLSVAAGGLAVALDQQQRGPWHVGVLAVRPIVSGGIRKVCTNVWYADDNPRGQGRAIVSQVEGQFQLEYEPEGVKLTTGGAFSHPRVSRDGLQVAVIRHPLSGDTGGQVAVVDRTNELRVVGDKFLRLLGLAWSAAGDEIWVTGSRKGNEDELFAIDPETGETKSILSTPGQMRLHDVHPDGRVLLSIEDTRLRMAGRRGNGEPEQDLSYLDWTHARAIGTDGEKILFEESGDGTGGAYQVYLRGFDGDPPVHIGEGTASSLSPDGQWALAFEQAATSNNVVLLPTGVGRPVQLTDDERTYVSGVWHPNERSVFCAARQGDEGLQLSRFDLDTGEQSSVGPKGILERTTYPITPDGREIVLPLTVDQHILVSLQDGSTSDLPKSEIGDQVVGWTTDTDRKFIVARTWKLPCPVLKVDPDSGAEETLFELIPADRTGLLVINLVRLTPDCKRYIYTYGVQRSTLFCVTGLHS